MLTLVADPDPELEPERPAIHSYEANTKANPRLIACQDSRCTFHILPITTTRSRSETIPHPPSKSSANISVIESHSTIPRDPFRKQFPQPSSSPSTSISIRWGLSVYCTVSHCIVSHCYLTSSTPFRSLLPWQNERERHTLPCPFDADKVLAFQDTATMLCVPRIDVGARPMLVRMF